MRLHSKYKKFNKLTINFKEFPSRILKFHRTKWKKIQQILLKTPNKNFLMSVKKVLYIKRWNTYKYKFLDGIKLKRYFDCYFDKAFSLLFFKKLKFLNKKLNNIKEISTYLVKPEFRIDIFFFRLKFFSSCYEARRYINNNFIKINNKKTYSNYFLKKGDIITFNFENYFIKNYLKVKLQKTLNNNKFLTFIEIDYYTNTVILLKDYNELTEIDMVFFISNFCDIHKFKTFIQ